MFYSHESTQLLNYTGSGKFGQFNRYIGNLVSLNFSVMLGDIIDRFNYHNDKKKLSCFKKYYGSWFYYKVEDCTERTCLSKYKQNSAISLLEKYQILVSKKIGISSKRHVRLNLLAVNLFILNPEKIIKYFDENQGKEIKDFCNENGIEYSENIFNNSEIKVKDSKQESSSGRETLPLGERETLPLGERETLPLGERETLPPYITNPINEPENDRTVFSKEFKELGLDSGSIKFAKNYSDEKIEIAIYNIKILKPDNPSAYFITILKNKNLKKIVNKENKIDINKDIAKKVYKKYNGLVLQGIHIAVELCKDCLEINCGGINGVRYFKYDENCFEEILQKHLDKINKLKTYQ